MKRNRGRFTTILAVSGEKLPGSVVFPPTAAPLSPRCICPQAALVDNARHSPSALGCFFAHTKNSKHRKSDTCCFGRGRRDRTLGTRFWSGCLTAKIRLITAFSSLLLQIFNKTKCFWYFIDAIKKYNLKMLTKFSSMTLGLRMVVKILYEKATVQGFPSPVY